MSEREPTIQDVLNRLEAIHGHISEIEGRLGGQLTSVRADIMARLDRLQDRLGIHRDEQLVDQGQLTFLRRQLQLLRDRVQALEDRQ